MILPLLAILLVLKYGWTLFTMLFLLLALGVCTEWTLYRELGRAVVIFGVCEWRGCRWTIACTTWPGCFRRRCTRCGVIEASPDPRGGQPPTWIQDARRTGALSS